MVQNVFPTENSIAFPQSKKCPVWRIILENFGFREYEAIQKFWHFILKDLRYMQGVIMKMIGIGFFEQDHLNFLLYSRRDVASIFYISY